MPGHSVSQFSFPSYQASVLQNGPERSRAHRLGAASQALRSFGNFDNLVARANFTFLQYAEIGSRARNMRAPSGRLRANVNR
jgi:hypothetical protein